MLTERLIPDSSLRALDTQRALLALKELFPETTLVTSVFGLHDRNIFESAQVARMEAYIFKQLDMLKKFYYQGGGRLRRNWDSVEIASLTLAALAMNIELMGDQSAAEKLIKMINAAKIFGIINRRETIAATQKEESKVTKILRRILTPQLRLN